MQEGGQLCAVRKGEDESQQKEMKMSVGDGRESIVHVNSLSSGEAMF